MPSVGAHRRRAVAVAIGLLGAAAVVTVAVVSRSGDAPQITSRTSRPVEPAPTSARWNVVVVLTDDQPERTLTSMPVVQDMLVANGVTFTNAVASNPLCCPSRASVLSGRYAHTTGVWTNGGPYGGARRFIRWERHTFAFLLDRAGYTTGFFGKYLNGYGSGDPRRKPAGWDRWVAFAKAHRYYDYTLNQDGRLVAYGTAAHDYSTDVLARQAASFIARAREPFLLVIAPYAPHAPFEPAPRHKELAVSFVPGSAYNEADMRDKPRWARRLPRVDASAGAIAQIRTLRAVDELVGRLVGAVEARGAMGRTAFLYTSDNGRAWGDHRWLYKLVAWEESIRVPLVIRADGLAAPGERGQLVANVDLAPTVIELAGVRQEVRLDGRSLLPLLRDPSSKPIRSAVTLESTRYPKKLVPPQSPMRRVPSYCGLRQADWTYVQYATGEEELYDLRSDPHQLSNLAGRPSHLARIRELREEVRRRCRPLPPQPASWRLLPP
jgi:arylsulfatase A-like enzyme